MLKVLTGILSVMTMLLNTAPVYAGNNAGRGYPSTKCDKKLVRAVFDEENTELMDAVRKYYQEGEKHGWTDAEFCAWLRGRYEKTIEAKFRNCLRCQQPEPRTPEVDRSVPEDVRQAFREIPRRTRPAPPPEPEEPPPPRGGPDNGGFMQSPFMGGLLGGALGGFLGAMLAGRMNQQHQNYFPQPQFPPNMMPGMPGMPGGFRPGAPGVLPFPGAPGAPGVLPLTGQFGGNPYAQPYGGNFPGGNPWAAPYPGGAPMYAGGYGTPPYVGGYGFGNYGGYAAAGGFTTGAPGVLPLAPQSTFTNYGLTGTIPQSHWSLINVGR